MRITIYYLPSAVRPQVTLHGWDQNGGVWDVPGVLMADGISFSFTLTGTTSDQRDVSFLYRFGAANWESNAFTRTVPTTDATELWTRDFSARCATAAPGPPGELAAITVHAITLNRFNGGGVYAWTSGSSDGELFPQIGRDDGATTSTFALPMKREWQAGFLFKLAPPGGDLSKSEPDDAIRFWQPSDGAQIWVKSGEPFVESAAIRPVDIPVDFLSPSAWGAPQLNITDLIGDFNSTLNPSAPAVGETFSSFSFTVTVYTGASYQIWSSNEPIAVARRFRIPMGGLTDPSIAVNGYDQWLTAIPVSAAVRLIVHPSPSTTFGTEINVEVGVAAAGAHQTIQAVLGADGTWTAQLAPFQGVPFWAALVGESRPDGPLDFKRGILGGAEALTLHTIDGVGGASLSVPSAFQDPGATLRSQLMQAVFSEAVVAANIFNTWELPHGPTQVGDTVHFVVRAPHAVTCSVLIMPVPNGAGVPRAVLTFPMSLTPDLRYWWVGIPAGQAPHGTLYPFGYSDGWELLDPAGGHGEALDPASRWCYNEGSLTVTAGSGAEASWSMVAYQSRLESAFAGSQWDTAGWPWLSIYEMHPQRLTQRNAGAVTDFDQVAAELNGGYLSRLPLTALELLPLHEVPGNQRGWGYNPALFFAIDSSHGGPENFSSLVRKAHDTTKGVLLDLVYNHMVGSPLQILARDVYVSGETQWGDMIYFAHPAACELFRQATLFLWKTFRIDGFRFDSSETIVNGGNPNAPSVPYVIAKDASGNYLLGAGHGWEFLGMLHAALDQAADAIRQPHPYTVGENNPENPPLTDPASGILDGQWHFSQMYTLNNAAQNDVDHASDVQGNLNSTGVPFNRSVVYGESHDSASGQDWTKRIAATEKWGFGMQMAKAVGTVALLAQGIPMIFMGQEAGETQPFLFNAQSTDPGFTLPLSTYETVGTEQHSVLTWFTDLIGLRNNASNGFQGVTAQSTGYAAKTVSFARNGGQFFVIVTFGTPNTHQDLSWLGLPGGQYKEVFNSSWPQYAVHAEPLAANGGYAATLQAGNLVNLPAIGAVVLQRS